MSPLRPILLFQLASLRGFFFFLPHGKINGLAQRFGRIVLVHDWMTPFVFLRHWSNLNTGTKRTPCSVAHKTKQPMKSANVTLHNPGRWIRPWLSVCVCARVYAHVHTHYPSPPFEAQCMFVCVRERYDLS